jgi:hypothetical protein
MRGAVLCSPTSRGFIPPRIYPLWRIVPCKLQAVPGMLPLDA